MTDLAWEKPVQEQAASAMPRSRVTFLAGGAVLLGVVMYLIFTATTSGAQYYITVEELVSNPDYIGQRVRVSGAVIGETIQYDQRNLIIDFNIAHIPQRTQDLAYTLYLAANDPEAVQMPVNITDQVKPDLLEHEAQAILTGRLGEDGVFYATELLLKCPSRYEEASSDQVAGEGA
ncbi:MAG: cytochrome c maturation protein CcmE [Phototrophicaceae bacterium]